MYDTTEDGERVAESRAESDWQAEYVDPYRGVPLPNDWRQPVLSRSNPPVDIAPALRDAWRAGVDAALTLHSDVIKRCNAALQQATGAAVFAEPFPAVDSEQQVAGLARHLLETFGPLVTTCRVLQVGPACATPCQSCRAASAQLHHMARGAR
jgi:hypothetical protein